MILLEPTYLSNIVDYSFGDQGSVINGLPGCWMKDANINNKEFIDKYNQVKNTKKTMTLFIDNIRLYKRDVTKMMNVKPSDYEWVNNLMENSDLLKLCSSLGDIKFIIFTGFEDTAIDEFIFNNIPDNVLGIYASNAITFGGKVHPIPYGLQRVMREGDNRLEILKNSLHIEIVPENLLYCNHTINHNPNERNGINDIFINSHWATVNTSRIDYTSYLNNIRKHKFMICPYGNAVDCDCHRNWEVLYMRRVPIMKRCKYLEYIFKDFPVLFVEEYADVTEKLLIDNEHIYNQALNLDLKKLDFELIYNDIMKQFN